MPVNVIETLPADSTALIVVDVQKAFTTEPMAQERLSNMRSVVDFARDTGLTVVFTRSVRRSDEQDAPQNVYDVVPKTYRGNEPTCCAGTTDVDYGGEIEPRPEEYEISKQRYDAFHGTKLDYYLRAEDIDTVLMTGISTNVCVEATARSAHERGYGVVYLEDACASHSRELHEAAIRNAENILGTVIQSDELPTLFE